MKKIVSTTEAPAAIGLTRKRSGPVHSFFARARSRSIIVSEDIAEQIRRVFQSVTAILPLTLAHVVKNTVFLADFGYFQEMNEGLRNLLHGQSAGALDGTYLRSAENAKAENEAIAFERTWTMQAARPSETLPAKVIMLVSHESCAVRLGSARASRAGEGALASANFAAIFRRGGRNEHARARALPGAP